MQERSQLSPESISCVEKKLLPACLLGGIACLWKINFCKDRGGNVHGVGVRGVERDLCLLHHPLFTYNTQEQRLLWSMQLKKKCCEGMKTFILTDSRKAFHFCNDFLIYSLWRWRWELGKKRDGLLIVTDGFANLNGSEKMRERGRVGYEL